ncbi:MAG: glyceraldehyde dehydrogenase subunit beta [Sulfolobaceae archaeon]|nr:glyceraldehyde dehydrogenase subunit beta [Sulfolobaceae archaeon]
MYPPDFAYYIPNSIYEAVDFLGRYDNARPLAGGQSLLPMLKLRLLNVDYIVDLNPLKELDYVSLNKDYMEIGALTRYYEVLKSSIVNEKLPLLSMVIRKVGDMQVRNMGTIAGSLANADPASDTCAVTLVFDADIVTTSSSGNRVIKARDFFKGPFTTALAKDEIVTAIRYPILEGYKFNFVKVVRRAGDYPLVSVAVAVKLKDGVIEDLRLGYAGVSQTPYRPFEVEKSFIGKSLKDSIEDIVSKVVEGVNPPSDTRGSSSYRKEVMRNVTRKALREVMG